MNDFDPIGDTDPTTSGEQRAQRDPHERNPFTECARHNPIGMNMTSTDHQQVENLRDIERQPLPPTTAGLLAGCP